MKVVHLLRFRHLRVLSLRDTRLTDAGLATLAQLPELTEIYVGGTAVTPEGRATFADALPTCAVKD